jgi:curved DNA-binding protein CbpA
MQVKDYYKILEVEPGAAEADIKKNFRKLALRYHPDTNGGNQQANAWYREIQEAYEVLTDPRKKALYHQERWLLKSTGKPFADTFPLTPYYIEKKCAEFEQNVRLMDHFRMDHKALEKRIDELLNNDVLDALREQADFDSRKSIIELLQKSMGPLDYKFTGIIFTKLFLIADNDPVLIQSISNFKKSKQQEAWWAKHQGWIIALVTIALLLGIIAIVP